MSSIICPECGKEQVEDTVVCSKCGFPLKAKEKRQLCSECGTVLQKGTTFCYNCGYDNVDSKSLTENVVDGKHRIIGIALIAVACLVFVLAFTRINNEKYDFYLEHYKECMNGYDESIDLANSSGGLFRGSYNSIANSYENMAEDDMEHINEYRLQAVIFGVLGIVLIIVGCRFINKKVLKYVID